MPIQAPQWTDYLSCPVCCREFGAPPRCPVSLGCGHTLCRHCLNHLHKKQCPFDQTLIQLEPDELVVNTALLQLAGYSPPAQPYHPPCIQALSERDKAAYDVIVRCLEHLAVFLKYSSNGSALSGSRLSRPMQRKLVTMLQCAITDEEGRGRMARAARSLGERTVTELILQHQNPQQISAYLWAAVRARGCQFLGPAMQEEVLKLVLLALEDGSALSRKVLVMFVVQRLKPHFPQASKTSIGHVVQLLYRASCFKVSKRECDSSLMQLKEEFRTYECLRREHDAQIVQIATESGLRIAPDQWSALLYGDAAHKSHMQSIIDKLQSPQSFAQSVHELFIALHRTGDPARLVLVSAHLERLAAIDASPEAESPSWQQLAETMMSLKEVVSGLVLHLQTAPRDSNHKLAGPDAADANHIVAEQAPSQGTLGTFEPRFSPRNNYSHSEDEMERYQWLTNAHIANGNYYPEQQIMVMPFPPNLTHPTTATANMPLMMMGNAAQAMGPVEYGPLNAPPPRLAGGAGPRGRAPSAPGAPAGEQPPPPLLPGVDTGLRWPALYPGYNAPPRFDLSPNRDAAPSRYFVPIADVVPGQRFRAALPEEQAQVKFQQDFQNPGGFQGPVMPHVPHYQELAVPHRPPFQNQNPAIPHDLPRGNFNHGEPPVPNNSPYMMEESQLAEYRAPLGSFEPRQEPPWSPPTNNNLQVFNFTAMNEVLAMPSTSQGAYAARRPAPPPPHCSNYADDRELEEELLALERRICTEFKSTD